MADRMAPLITVASIKDDVRTIRKEVTFSRSRIDALEEKLNTVDGNCIQSSQTAVGDLALDELRCTLCRELFVQASTLHCSHTFCKLCIDDWRKSSDICPVCGERITGCTPFLVLDHFIAKTVESSPKDIKERHMKNAWNRGLILNEIYHEWEPIPRRGVSINQDQSKYDTRRSEQSQFFKTAVNSDSSSVNKGLVGNPSSGSGYKRSCGAASENRVDEQGFQKPEVTVLKSPVSCHKPKEMFPTEVPSSQYFANVESSKSNCKAKEGQTKPRISSPSKYDSPNQVPSYKSTTFTVPEANMNVEVSYPNTLNVDVSTEIRQLSNEDKCGNNEDTSLISKGSTQSFILAVSVSRELKVHNLEDNENSCTVEEKSVVTDLSQNIMGSSLSSEKMSTEFKPTSSILKSSIKSSTTPPHKDSCTQSRGSTTSATSPRGSASKVSKSSVSRQDAKNSCGSNMPGSRQSLRKTSGISDGVSSKGSSCKKSTTSTMKASDSRDGSKSCCSKPATATNGSSRTVTAKSSFPNSQSKSHDSMRSSPSTLGKKKSCVSPTHDTSVTTKKSLPKTEPTNTRASVSEATRSSCSKKPPPSKRKVTQPSASTTAKRSCIKADLDPELQSKSKTAPSSSDNVPQRSSITKLMSDVQDTSLKKSASTICCGKTTADEEVSEIKRASACEPQLPLETRTSESEINTYLSEACPGYDFQDPCGSEGIPTSEYSPSNNWDDTYGQRYSKDQPNSAYLATLTDESSKSCDEPYYEETDNFLKTEQNVDQDEQYCVDLEEPVNAEELGYRQRQHLKSVSSDESCLSEATDPFEESLNSQSRYKPQEDENCYSTDYDMITDPFVKPSPSSGQFDQYYADLDLPENAAELGYRKTTDVCNKELFIRAEPHREKVTSAVWKSLSNFADYLGRILSKLSIKSTDRSQATSSQSDTTVSEVCEDKQEPEEPLLPTKPGSATKPDSTTVDECSEDKQQPEEPLLPTKPVSTMVSKCSEDKQQPEEPLLATKPCSATKSNLATKPRSVATKRISPSSDKCVKENKPSNETASSPHVSLASQKSKKHSPAISTSKASSTSYSECEFRRQRQKREDSKRRPTERKQPLEPQKSEMTQPANTTIVYKCKSKTQQISPPSACSVKKSTKSKLDMKTGSQQSQQSGDQLRCRKQHTDSRSTIRSSSKCRAKGSESKGSTASNAAVTKKGLTVLPGQQKSHSCTGSRTTKKTISFAKSHAAGSPCAFKPKSHSSKLNKAFSRETRKEKVCLKETPSLTGYSYTSLSDFKLEDLFRWMVISPVTHGNWTTQ